MRHSGANDWYEPVLASMGGGKEFWNANAMKTLRDDWKVQNLRGAMGIELDSWYIDDPVTAEKIMRRGVEGAIENGLYFIVDIDICNVDLFSSF